SSLCSSWNRVITHLLNGKSKDHLIMKQNEEEWVEYQQTMENVITMSGLDKSVFYDLRGNHDNFGVPVVGGAFDYFSNYSITGQLGRSQSVNSVTLQSSNRNHLFVSFDSTMSIGLRGPTNLFGHPTDQLLSELNSHLSQWDSTSTKPLTKIGFGHFPLSFSAPSNSKRTLKEIFLKNSITAYLCGHLHLKFGKNLKRHHDVNNEMYRSLFQWNMHQKGSSSSTNCSNGGQTVNEFWELEMGDWRKSRAMRVMAIDKGRVSFIDTDLKMGAKKMLILPTYPLDSRFMSATALNKYKCESMEDTSHVRALVFSSRLITSVKAKIYDSSHGHLDMENLYTVPWNSKAFMDSSPDRYLLQIEAIDINGDISVTELMPFSVTGFHSDLSWTWKEFFVLGCQWGYMTYKGWVVNFDDIKNLEFIGFPDIMVVVINHLYFVVLPTILIIGAVAAERSVYQDHVHSLSGKKRDDHGVYNEGSRSKSGNISKQLRKWARGILVIFSLAVCWKHFKVCII
nr:putative metallophosphoesterase At3g03305 [Tanacetum cinerariifolium]